VIVIYNRYIFQKQNYRKDTKVTRYFKTFFSNNIIKDESCFTHYYMTPSGLTTLKGLES